MNLVKAVVLAIIQGLTELLPVSSSAHVIITAKLLQEDMSTPANALLLVMLHTGTMVAVIVYFWRQWMETFFSSWQAFWNFACMIFVACFLSGAVGYPIILLVEHVLGGSVNHAQIEDLFNKLDWVAPALAAAGILILYSGLREARNAANNANGEKKEVSWPQAVVMGIIQGFAIPFRGFSRSGSTISAGLLADGARVPVESFSFAMAVAITPLAIAREVYRLVRADHLAASHLQIATVLAPSLLGLGCAFLAGLVALKWLSRWLERGHWYWFGIYCLLAAVAVELLYLQGW
jgi:undecaprenyl-diphosphatase